MLDRQKLWGVSALQLHLHLGARFNARAWFSREGKTVMAQEYYKWRLRQTAYAKWCLYVAAHSD